MKLKTNVKAGDTQNGLVNVATGDIAVQANILSAFNLNKA